jgi:hypothetical protein
MNVRDGDHLDEPEHPDDGRRPDGLDGPNRVDMRA